MRKYQYYNTNDDDDRDGYGANWMSQTFTPETDHVIGAVKLKLFRVGDPGTITVSIKATSGGKPIGADLCSGTIEGTDITLDTNGEWYEISLGDGFDLDIGAQYAIVVKAPNGDTNNKISWRADITSPTYTGGTYCDSSDSGTDWNTYSGVDCMFEEWGVGPASPSTVVWGNLYKSQISAEKIEEAIARLIQNHENDPNAHVEVGESLYSHKASEIIDHVVNSIINDKVKTGEISQEKLSADELQVYTAFESLDAWAVSSGVTLNALLGVTLQTSNVSDTLRYMNTEPAITGSINDYSKEIFFQTVVQFQNLTNMLAFFMTGDYQNDESDNGFGFKVLNGNLYAIVVKEVGGFRTEYTTQITGITLTNLNVFKAKLNPTEGKIYFYVNGVLKHTESTNLPTGNHPVLFNYSIKNTATENKIMTACYLLYSRKI